MARSLKKKKSSPASGAPTPRKPPSSAFPWPFYLKLLLIIAAGLWALSPALPGDWDGDDDFYLTNNPLLHDPAHLWKIWFAPGSFIEYYPITATLQMVQWHFWHHDAFGYVLTNILLHLLNALLVWRLLHELGLRQGWLGGLIFAIHPLNVESVAWISEVKNTLSLTPCLLAMIAWIHFDETRQVRTYLLSLGLFVLALLCKISTAPFAVVILVYAWWKRGKVGLADLLASLPFIVVAFALGLLDYLVGFWFTARYAQQKVLVHLDGFLGHFVLGGECGAFYFAKFFWPWPPEPFYPQWRVDPGSFTAYLPWLVLGAALSSCWRYRQTWGRHVLLGVGFFYLMLVTIVGFVDGSFMNFTWVMDHFLYLPMIGWIGLVVAGMEQVYRLLAPRFRPVSLGALTLLLLALAWQTHTYAGIYRTQESLDRYGVRVNPNSFMAHCNLGGALLAQGDINGALQQYQEALDLSPDSDQVHYRMAEALLRANRLEEARAHFQETVRLVPKFADAYDELGATLLQLGRPDEAAAALHQALKITDFAQAHNDLGNVLLQTNHPEEAIAEYRKAVQLQPYVAPLHDNLALALFAQKQIPETIAQFQTALALDPNDQLARNALQKLQAEATPSP